MTRNAIVIGSGPAGYTAATYLARAGLDPLVFEGFEYGGELTNTTEVENYPGFADGILGPDLMDRMRDQASRFGAELRSEDVDATDLAGPVKTVVADNVAYTARAVVLATGSAPNYLGVPGEREKIGRGVSTCATCDGFFFKGKNIVVVGGGDSAMTDAIFLSRFAETVTIVHRRNGFRASAIMLDRAENNPSIGWITNSRVVSVNGEDTVESISIQDSITGEKQQLPIDGMFLAIGHTPRTETFSDQIKLRAHGYVEVNDHQHTSMPGVFACGDVADPTFQQAVTAAGSGCKAALSTQWFLENEKL